MAENSISPRRNRRIPSSRRNQRTARYSSERSTSCAKNPWRHTRTYRSWDSMLTRCTNPKTTEWKRYGGAGITVCARWYTFANFLEDMGERPPNTSIDRINPAGNYEPENCRWATPSEQTGNRRKFLE